VSVRPRDVFIHPTAEVSSLARIGTGTRIWHQAQVRDGAIIGEDCTLGKGAFVDVDVIIGDRCKLENGVNVFQGAVIENGVFLGPAAQLLNDLRPRATNVDGTLKGPADWKVAGVTVRESASVGGAAVILPGVTIGRYALVGAGAVVTRDVADHWLVVGNPARLSGYACRCGERLPDPAGDTTICSSCGTRNSLLTRDSTK
jgi:UDP-2-acetamido-3-amino-2,3-dideoxy-glucuronate N-acetyltransferase